MCYLDALGGVDMWHGAGPVGRKSHDRGVGLEHRRRELAAQHIQQEEQKHNSNNNAKQNMEPNKGAKHWSVMNSRWVKNGSRHATKRECHDTYQVRRKLVYSCR